MLHGIHPQLDSLRRLVRPGLAWPAAAAAALWLVAAYYLPVGAPGLGPAERWLVAALAVALGALSLAAHGLAHLAAARRLGAPAPDHLPLWLFGDVAHVWPPAADARDEVLGALAGPVASGALAGLAALAWAAQLGPAADATALFVAALNAGLATLNLAPAAPLDGGRLLRLALAGVVRRPELVAAGAGVALGCALLGWGAYVVSTESRFSVTTGLALAAAAAVILLAVVRHRPPRARPEALHPPARRALRGAGAALLGLGLLAAPLAIVPTPYGLYAPGAAAPAGPMVEVAGLEPEPSDGALLITTVVAQTPILAVEWLAGQLDRTITIVAPERVVPEDVSPQELMAENARLLAESRAVATVVALRLAGYAASFTGSGAEVLRVLPESRARDLLQPGDRIVALGGAPVRTAADLSPALGALDAASPAEVLVVRGGQELALSLPLMQPAEPGGVPRIGIAIATADVAAAAPLDVSITPRSIVGGPSAGLMFTLAIYDRLTPGDLTRGWTIAGTGTVGADGQVGPIGGVAQKVAAAERAGAAYFLAPRENAADARRAARDITVIEVGRVEDALAALQALPER